MYTDHENQHLLDLTATISMAKKWALAVGQMQREKQSLHHSLQTKSSNIDLVTEIDMQSEIFLIDAIRSLFPEHGILSEEAGSQNIYSPYQWIIDPLDGTTNYAQGLPIYSVSIALQEHKKTILGVIYVPMLDQMFEVIKGHRPLLNGREISTGNKTKLADCVLATGFPYDRATHPDNNLNYFSRIVPKIRGIVRMGSAAYDLACVAAGYLDGFWELNLSLWDVAAGALMVEEAGGKIIYLPQKRGVSLVAGNHPLCREILAELEAENARGTRAQP